MAARSIPRALRSIQSTSRTPLIRSSNRFAAPTQTFRQQSRRGYADGGAAPSSGGGKGILYALGIGSLGAGAYYAYSQGLFDQKESPQSKPFEPKFEDYQKVYDAIA